MKRGTVCFLIIILTLVFGACHTEAKTEEKRKEPFSAETGLFLYEGTEEAEVIAVDEEGYLYTATCISEIDIEEEIIASEYVYEPFVQQFKVYDLEGTCVKEVKVGVGNGSIRFLTAEEGNLYCIVNKATLDTYMDTLYCIDTETWKVTELYGFDDYSSISNFVHIGDYFYVIGTLENLPAKNYELHPDVISYTYLGESISRIKVGEENLKEELLPIDFPIDIVGTKKDTLLIYHYNEKQGFGFLEFNPDTLALSEVSWKKSSLPVSYFTKCENGFLFYKEGGIFYGTADGMEAGISSEQISISCIPTYQRGFLFYINNIEDAKIVERVGIADLIKENTAIRLLMHKDVMDKPYDNGYQMEKTILDSEAYALKVLAQDSDFDMLILDSRNSMSYNIKEKGVFYALNEIDGVKEYLDACFPYIKEVAINEEGDIWMIPVGVSIAGLQYHKEYCAMNEVDLSKMNFQEFLALVEQVETETPKQGSISSYLVIRELFQQYLSVYDSFDTDIFRAYAKQIKMLNEKLGDFYSEDDVLDRLSQNNELELFYDYNQNIVKTMVIAKRLEDSDVIGVTGVPKLSENLRNIGRVTFLAVNPQAENLEVTLEYISDFCNYMMNQQDSFLLSDESMYTDIPYIKEWYQVYANGSIFFEMESDVYWNTFWDYVRGDMELEEMIEEIERKREIYVGE